MFQKRHKLCKLAERNQNSLSPQLSMFKEKENLFNVLFEAASEGIIVVDETQTMVVCNAAYSLEKQYLVSYPSRTIQIKKKIPLPQI